MKAFDWTKMCCPERVIKILVNFLVRKTVNFIFIYKTVQSFGVWEDLFY